MVSMVKLPVCNINSRELLHRTIWTIYLKRCNIDEEYLIKVLYKNPLTGNYIVQILHAKYFA